MILTRSFNFLIDAESNVKVAAYFFISWLAHPHAGILTVICGHIQHTHNLVVAIAHVSYFRPCSVASQPVIGQRFAIRLTSALSLQSPLQNVVRDAHECRACIKWQVEETNLLFGRGVSSRQSLFLYADWFYVSNCSENLLLNYTPMLYSTLRKLRKVDKNLNLFIRLWHFYSNGRYG